METYQITHQKHGASYDLIIYGNDGVARTIVGFKDRAEIATWVEHAFRLGKIATRQVNF